MGPIDRIGRRRAMAGYPPAATIPPYPFSDLLVLDLAYFLDVLRIGVESSVRSERTIASAISRVALCLFAAATRGPRQLTLLKHFTTSRSPEGLRRRCCPARPRNLCTCRGLPQAHTSPSRGSEVDGPETDCQPSIGVCHGAAARPKGRRDCPSR